MGTWSRVKWSEAGQVLARTRIDQHLNPDESAAPPQQFFFRLLDEERLEQAVFYLSLALPRYDGVAWAVEALDRLSPEPPDQDERVRLLAKAWLADPTDARRLAVWTAAERIGRTTPDQLLGLALFMSGGSMSLEDLPPVLPPDEASGQAAAGAIILACHQTDDASASLRAALTRGAEIAERGPN